MSEVEKLFSPIIGQLCWNVKRGYGSSLHMEFGKSHLQVREPSKSIDPDVTPRVREMLSHRSVFVYGEWSLLIDYGNWTAEAGGKSGWCNDKRDAVRKVLRLIDGQRLTSVVAEQNKPIELRFDLGGLVKISQTDVILPNSSDPEASLFLLSDYRVGEIHGYYLNGKLETDKTEKQFLPGSINILERFARSLTVDESKQRWSELKDLWFEFNPLGTGSPDTYEQFVGPVFTRLERDENEGEIAMSVDTALLGTSAKINDDQIKAFVRKVVDWYRSNWKDAKPAWPYYALYERRDQDWHFIKADHSYNALRDFRNENKLGATAIAKVPETKEGIEAKLEHLRSGKP